MAEVVFPSVPAGSIYWEYDAALNDSDKSFTVPAGHVWELLYVGVDITCTATVGNRTLTCTITDGTNRILYCPRTAAITAGQTGALRVYFGGSLTSTTTSDAPLLAGGTPNVAKVGAMQDRCLLPEGFVVTCSDIAAIDAAADDMVVVLCYIDYPVREL